MTDTRNFSPSFERNIGPITSKLDDILAGQSGSALEIGSGSGQHSVTLAKHFTNFEFQPTEMYSENLESIAAWIEFAKLANVRDAINLNVTSKDWGLTEDGFDLLFAFNVIHYAPWNVTRSIFENGSQYLKAGARVMFYGPYKIDGAHTCESNEEFDKWLLDRNPNFGVRDIGDITEIAKECGFFLETFHPMPANNFMPEFIRK